MLWLIGQMWGLLALAFVLGVAIGWWIHNSRAVEAGLSAKNADADGDMSTDSLLRAPDLLTRPEFGPKDDLTQIIGLDEATETRLNDLGVYYLRQIAEWGSAQTRWVENAIEAPGRIDREHWVEQARSTLA